MPFFRFENIPNITNDDDNNHTTTANNDNFKQAVVYSEGILYLDDCDFSGSAAAQLVEGGETTVVRNAVLGDKNCKQQAVVPYPDPDGNAVLGRAQL